jgi:hypothetical protein
MPACTIDGHEEFEQFRLELSADRPNVGTGSRGNVENNVRPRRSPRTVRVASMNAALEEEIELDIVWSKPWVIEMAFEGGFYQYKT